MFRDITPLLSQPRVFRVLIDQFVHRYFDVRPDVIAGLDARGFIIGSVVAYELNVGFVPIRKKGKLPFTTMEETYELEYGSATVEIHTDAVKPGDRVLLIDDLIATGGTMMAGKKLLERLGAQVIEGAAIVDLPELGGSDKLRAAGAGAVHAGGLRRPLSAPGSRTGCGSPGSSRKAAPASRRALWPNPPFAHTFAGALMGNKIRTEADRLATPPVPPTPGTNRHHRAAARSSASSAARTPAARRTRASGRKGG